ncbi:MAG: hypothetical protein RQ757_10260 [Pseudomonadales bacterium]|nr:hypothetical protein [Pseudomonadales bacterium]
MKLFAFKINRKTRATLAGVLIAAASLYALSAAYDITLSSLFGLLLGSLLLLVAAMLLAFSLVFISKNTMRLFRRKTKEPGSNEKNDTFKGS